MKSKRKAKLLRIFSLSGFVIFLTWTAYMHIIKGGGAAGVPSIDALCPLGGLETLRYWISEGLFLRRTAPSSLILFGIVAIMTFAFGRVFCGWICPLGAISEFFAFLSRKLPLPHFPVPRRIDGALKYLKYLVLFGILTWTFSLGTLAWRDYDPWVAWAHMAEGWDGIETRPWAYIILLTTVMLGSLFIERLWCRYLCPLGAALGIIGTLTPLKVGKAKGAECTNCALCYPPCPVQLQPQEGNVSSSECLVCGKCVSPAPTRCGVDFRFAGRRISILRTGVLVLILFFGGYGAAKMIGIWKTFMPVQVTAGMTPTQVADTVFGWMSLKQVAETTGIPIERIKHKAGVDVAVSEEESIKKLGIDDTKIKEAVKSLAEQGGSSKVSPQNPVSETPSSAKMPNPMEISGMKTLADLEVIYGFKPSIILKESGWPENLSVDVPLRELKAVTGQEVEVIRQAVKRLLLK